MSTEQDLVLTIRSGWLGSIQRSRGWIRYAMPSLPAPAGSPAYGTSPFSVGLRWRRVENMPPSAYIGVWRRSVRALLWGRFGVTVVARRSVMLTRRIGR